MYFQLLPRSPVICGPAKRDWGIILLPNLKSPRFRRDKELGELRCRSLVIDHLRGQFHLKCGGSSREKNYGFHKKNVYV